MENKFSIPRNILDRIDIAGLMTKMAKADWYYDYTDDPKVWEKGRVEINGIKEDLLQLSKLEQGIQVANQLWTAYVPPHSVQKPEFQTKVKNNLSSQKSTLMIEKNYDFLSNQLRLTGFGEDLKNQLKELMTKNEPQFTMALTKNYGNDETAVTLHFKRPEDSEMYFFNRYSMMLKNNQHPDAIKQTFYINPEGGNITMKEAYNLMCGRAVHKELTTKEGEKYNAWLQLDFKETDKHGNFVTKQFHQNYGYNLNAVLEKHPIKELAADTDRSRLVESLERGNRQSVTLEIKGNDVKVFIEASPQFKSLNFFEATGQRIRTDKLYENSSQGESEKAEKKQSQKQGKDEDTDGEPGTKKKRNRRQSIS